METTLTRDCSATQIPAGTAVTLKEGESVLITQTLGGNVTVRTDGGLYRIANVDVDALENFDQEEVAQGSSGSAEEFSEELVWDVLKQCYDPEIPINIVDLGLIYDMRIENAGNGKRNVNVKMTLTAQGCGMGPVIAQDAKTRIELLDDVEEADVQIVWDPVWNPQMISEDGRKILGI